MTDPGIFVIGFHGVAVPDETPAQSEPILATEDGRVAFEQPDGTFAIEHVKVPVGPLPRATRLEWFIKARPGWLVLVLGPEDIAALDGSRSEEAREVVSRRAEQDRFATREVGHCLAVYADPSRVERVWQVLRDEIRARMMVAVREGGGVLEHAAWRLQRAAVNDEDRYDALAGLRCAGSRSWRRAIQALYPEREDEVAAEVDRRSACLLRSHASDAGDGRYGALSMSRQRMRSSFFVQQEAA